MVLGFLYGLATALFVAAGLISLRFATVDVARDATIVIGAAVVLIFTVLPLTVGSDDSLDPRRFGLFGIGTTKLATVLVFGAIVSVPALVITAIALAQLVTWSRDGLSEVLAIIAAVLIVVTCLLSSRIATSLASFLLATRRARDFTAVSVLVTAIALSPLVVVAATLDWRTDGLALLDDIANFLAWTPLGAAWAIPGDAATGHPDASLGKLALAVGWVLILATIWRILVGAMLTTPVRRPHARTYTGLGWFDWFARTPTGVIAARSLTYWFRDSRYATNLLIIPFIPLAMVGTLAIAGIPLNWLALLPVPVMCLFLSWFVHNDIAFDNTAIWMHMSTSTKGRADRWGRVIPVLVVGVPLIAVGSVVSALLFGDFEVVLSLIGVSVSVLFAGLGLSSITSASFPYPTVRPGDSPFSQPQGVGSPAGAIQAISFISTIALGTPAGVAAYLALTVSPAWHALALLIGLGVGLVALVVGVGLGAIIYDRRTSELLVFATKN